MSFVPALVPLGLSDPAKRLGRVVDYTKETKKAGVRTATDAHLRGLGGKLPPFLLRLALRLFFTSAFHKLGTTIKLAPSVDLYLTHVRGISTDAFIGERRLIGLTGLAPLLPNTGLTCTAVSHRGRLFIGLTADSVSFPEVEDFIGEMHASFEELLASGSYSRPEHGRTAAVGH